MLVKGVAAVEGVAHVVVAEVGGVAAAAPRVIAQPLHGAAVDGGRKAALVVFNNIYIYMSHLSFAISLHTYRIHPQLKKPYF